MKLGQIRGTLGAWQVLSKLDKSPSLAYLLLKYERKVEQEMLFIEKARELLVYECAGVEKPTPPDVLIVSISPLIDVVVEEGAPPQTAPNPQYVAYEQKFAELMEVESSLEYAGITMDALIEALEAKKGNTLSEDVIGLLEPFFTPPEAPAV